MQSQYNAALASLPVLCQWPRDSDDKITTGTAVTPEHNRQCNGGLQAEETNR